MKFSNMVTYKGDRVHPAGEYYVVKTGRVRIRLLKPGDPYEKSFKVSLKAVSDRRPVEYVEDDDDDNVELEGQEEIVEDEDLEDAEYQPQ